MICAASTVKSDISEFMPETMSSLCKELVSLVTRFWDIFKPGGQFHPESFIESKGHLVLEGLLIAVISYLFLQKSFNPKAQKQMQTELTDQVRPEPSQPVDTPVASPVWLLHGPSRWIIA